MARENILVIFSSPNSFNKGSVCTKMTIGDYSYCFLL